MGGMGGARAILIHRHLGYESQFRFMSGDTAGRFLVAEGSACQGQVKRVA